MNTHPRRPITKHPGRNWHYHTTHSYLGDTLNFFAAFLYLLFHLSLILLRPMLELWHHAAEKAGFHLHHPPKRKPCKKPSEHSSAINPRHTARSARRAEFCLWLYLILGLFFLLLAFTLYAASLS